MTSSAARRQPHHWLQYYVARQLGVLPPTVQWRLSGPQVRLDGLALDPQLQLILAMRRWIGIPSLHRLTPDAARYWAHRQAKISVGRRIPVGAVLEMAIAGGSHPIRARHYVPAAPGGPHPLLVYFHGGGFVVGDLDTHDQACRLLCRDAQVHVLAVEYRLAPEHPFPAAVDDAWAALRAAAAQVKELGADPRRIAVGGDSAGGMLAAVAAQTAARAGYPDLALQVLLYPAIDRSRSYPSLELFANGFFLTVPEIAWFERHYAGAADRLDPRANPLCADLSGLPPAIVVTAGFDPLRDEGEAYAAAMAAAGTPVIFHREEGMIHAFMNMIDLSRSARAALSGVAATTRTALRPAWSA